MFCPYCGRQIADGSKFCGICGKRLIREETFGGRDAESASGQFASEQKMLEKTLPEKIESRKRTSETLTRGKKKKHKRKKWLWMVAELLVLAVLIAAAICLGLWESSSKAMDDEESAGDTENTENAEYLAAVENYAQVNDAVSELAASGDYTNAQTEEKAEQMLELLEELEEAGEIARDSIFYDEENQIIAYEYIDGAYGGVMLEDFAEGTFGLAGGDSYIIGYDENGLPLEPTDIIMSDLEAYPYEEENLSALIMVGVGDDWPEKTEELQQSRWNAAYLQTDMYIDATVAEYRDSLSGYDLVLIREHGFLYQNSPAISISTVPDMKFNVTTSEEDAVNKELKSYIEDLENHRIGLYLGAEDEQYHFFILPKFFSYYYGDSQLEGTIIWISCCDGYQDNSLVKAFADCGAKAVLGCTETVKGGYEFLMSDAFVYMLLYGNTVEDSLAFAKETWGDNDSIYWNNYNPEKEPDTDPSEFRYYNGGEETLVTLTAEVKAVLEEAENSIQDNMSVFDELPSEFVFTSGAGSWATILNIEADGSFTGEYFDVDLGVTGDGYPNGTEYICNFSGKFTTPKKISEYIYSMELEKLEMEEIPGTEYYENDIRYIVTTPYGLDDADVFYIYLPGAPIADLPEEFLSWVYMTALSRDAGDVLPSGFYGIYNEGGEKGFFGLDNESDQVNGGATEETLKNAFYDYTGENQYLYFYYDDFDGDGGCEAFAITGDEEDEWGLHNHVNIYFISENAQVSLVNSEYDLYGYLTLADGLLSVGEKKFLLWERSAGGSDSTTFIYGVKNEDAYEPEISGEYMCFGTSLNDMGIKDELQPENTYVGFSSDFSSGYHEYIPTYFVYSERTGEFVLY